MAVSSIKNGTPCGTLADRYSTSWFPFLRFAMKNKFDAASKSSVESMLVIVIRGKSFWTSFESGNDLHVYVTKQCFITIVSNYPTQQYVIYCYDH